MSLLDEYMPGIAGSVEHTEVLSPPDLEARYGLIGGNIMHGDLTLDLNRRVALRAGRRLDLSP